MSIQYGNIYTNGLISKQKSQFAVVCYSAEECLAIADCTFRIESPRQDAEWIAEYIARNYSKLCAQGFVFYFMPSGECTGWDYIVNNAASRVFAARDLLGSPLLMARSLTELL